MPKKSEFKPTKKQLKESIPSLIYEVQMLCDTTNLMHTQLIEGVLRNTLIESFVIHARNLIEFLYEGDKNKYDDTIFAKHYFKKASNWLDTKKTKPILLEETYVKAHKLAGHITYDRVKLENEDKKKWLYIDILLELLESMKEFFEKADYMEQDAKTFMLKYIKTYI